MKTEKSLTQQICEYITANPLCSTKDLAEQFDTSSLHMSKFLNRLETVDHVRGIKVSDRRNLWIRGTNDRFRRAGSGTNSRGNGGGVYYPKTGLIDRKRLSTITVSANDALALLNKGYSRLKVV